MVEIAGGIILAVVGLWLLWMLPAAFFGALDMMAGEKPKRPDSDSVQHSDKCSWACRVLNHKW